MLHFLRLRAWVVICVTALTATDAATQEVRLTAEHALREFVLNGEMITIARNQDTQARLEGEFTKTSRPCPPFCIAPMSAAPGVVTLGELEVVAFLENRVAHGAGLLLDSRVPEWFAKGTIPGAINLPFNTLSPDNPYRDEILRALGGQQTGTGWDFSAALELAMFCNGPWCEQSPTAIKHLIAAGYPAEKLSYYRGGMQTWLMLGLSTTQPSQ